MPNQEPWEQFKTFQGRRFKALPDHTRWPAYPHHPSMHYDVDPHLKQITTYKAAVGKLYGRTTLHWARVGAFILGVIPLSVYYLARQGFYYTDQYHGRPFWEGKYHFLTGRDTANRLAASPDRELTAMFASKPRPN